MADMLNYAPAPESRIAHLLQRHSGKARVAEWIAVTVILYFTIGVMTGVMMMFVRFFLYAGLLAVIIVSSALSMYHAMRLRQAGRVLMHAQGATRLSMPLAEYLRGAADAESSGVRRRLLGIATQLDNGTALSAALAMRVPEIGARTLRLIAMGESTHRLPEMLARVQRQRQDDRASKSNTRLNWYTPMMVIGALAVSAVLMIFVIPKFEMIMKDFKVTVPPLTRFFISLSRWIADDFGWLSLFAAIAACFGWVSWQAMHIVHPRSPGLKVRRRDVLLDRMPLVGGARLDRSHADLCWGLACAARDGRPIPEAVRELLGIPLHHQLASRLKLWNLAMEQGVSPADAANEAMLPPLVASVIRIGGERLPEALDVLGDFYDTRSHRILTLLRNSAVPLITVFFALIVAGIALSMFLPIQVITEQASNLVGSRR